jgi:Fe-S-cluster containining protein
LPRSGLKMIATSDLDTAINQATPMLESLQRSYQRLPETRCQCEQPGVCCAFLPEMTWIEALQWTGLIQQMPADARSRILQKFLEFYLTNPLRPAGCPFLVNGACGIYEWRPFACRAYGLWSPEFGKVRTQKSRQDRKSLLQMWQKFGLELPPQTVEFEIDYCGEVGCAAEKSMSDNQLMDILQKIYALDRALPDLQTKFEAEYHSDFSFLIASLALGYRKAVLGKFAVVKEMVQQGTEERLKQMLGRATAKVLGSS